jgi:hypothetical protein
MQLKNKFMFTQATKNQFLMIICQNNAFSDPAVSSTMLSENHKVS